MKGIYRFAEFELIATDGELRRNGSSIRLQEKPLLLLQELLDHPQTVVTRRQLRERMWDSQTFVDYELGINVAIKKVREALGDSADNPRFIQTVAKKGYRFLLPVQVVLPGGIATVPPTPLVGQSGLTESSGRNRHFIRFRWVYAITIVALACLVLSWLWLGHRTLNRPTQVHALAVLPLRNLSPDPAQEYLADGITEDLITSLAESLPIKVISRTSTMRYKQTNEPITQIARELGVEAIIEGSVVRAGDRVTLTVQLIDATVDRHLWAQRYDRQLGDLLGIEEELSQKVASQVGGTLHVAVQAARPHPVDPQVYDLCLLGRYHWNKRTAADLRKSIDYFQRAIDRDPAYAPAYAGLASAFVILPSYDDVNWEDYYARGVAAARHALQLDNTLAEAHATLGFAGLFYWHSEAKQVRQEFDRALELNPNDATAHHWSAYERLFDGHMDEALAQEERARQLDPLSTVINADEGTFLYAAGRDGDARVRLLQAIELSPNFGQPHETLALIDLEEGLKAEALREARSGLALDPTNPRTQGEAGYVLAITGHQDESRRLLATLIDESRRRSAFPFFPALIYIGLGQRSQALDVMERASQVGAGVHAYGQWRTILSQIDSDPRYKKLADSNR